MAKTKPYKPIIFRTRLAQDIVAEIAFPERQTGRVIILASGLPSLPSKRSVLEFLVGEGYAVVFPRYRGTWESDGYFLDRSPTQDIRDVIQTLEKEKCFWCIFSQSWIPLQVKNFFIIGSSFGGPAAIGLSESPLVKKVALLSPVLDWQVASPDEPFDEMIRFTMEGFGMATRLRSPNDWQKLFKKDFYSLPSSLSEKAKKKIILVHCFDDMVVPIGPAIEAVQNKKLLNHYFKPHGGHLGLSHITQLFFWHKIKNFFDTQ